jgi:hypothetical protein
MNYKKSLIYALYLSLSVAIISPINIIIANSKDFAIVNRTSFFLNLGLYFIGLAFIIFLFMLLLGLFNRKKWLFSLVVFILAINLYLPLPVGKLDGVDVLSVSVLNLLLSVAIGLLAYVLYKQKYLILFLITIGPLLMALGSLPKIVSTYEAAKILDVSQSEKNIFVLSFDAMQANFISSVINNNDELKKHFQGFRNFTNVDAVAPYTHLSLNLTKLGYLPDTNEKGQLEKHKQDFITTSFSKNNFDVETYGYFTLGEKNNTNRIPRFNMLPEDKESNYYKALSISIFRIYPIVQQVKKLRVLLELNQSNSPLDAFISKHPHPIARNKKDILHFEHFTKSLKVSDTKATFRMHHYVFTHDPIVFDENCNFKILKLREQKASIAKETECAVNKMIEFLKKLKQLAAYDNSLIVLTSDHGYECMLQNSSQSGSYKVSPRWCLSRYKPFLMAKDFNAREPFQNITWQASLIDIAITLCQQNLKPSYCKKHIGNNLFNNIRQSNNNPRPILLAKGAKDTRSYHFFNKIYIERDTSLEEYFKLRKN